MEVNKEIRPILCPSFLSGNPWVLQPGGVRLPKVEQVTVSPPFVCCSQQSRSLVFTLLKDVAALSLTFN